MVFFPPCSAISCFKAPRRAIEFGHQDVITGLAGRHGYRCASGISMPLRNTYANITWESEKGFNSEGESKYYVTPITRTVTTEETKALSFVKETKFNTQQFHLDFSRIQSISQGIILPCFNFQQQKTPTSALCLARCLKKQQRTSSESCATDTQTIRSFFCYRVAYLT